MIKQVLLVLSAFAFASAFTTGCASTEEHTGAAIGGVPGTTATATAPPGPGIVVGTLVGGLAGAAIGNYAYDQKRNYQEASSQYAYNYDQTRENLVRVENTDVSPNVVSPGGKVALAMTYTVLGPPNTPVEVTETRQVIHDGLIIGSPTVAMQRIGGTFESRIPVTLPKDAKPGVYVVKTTVASAGATDSRESSFTVE